MSRLKRFSKSICHCETQQSQRINYLKARKPISLLLALTIILSLFLVALPMAATTEASTDVSGEVTSNTTWDVAGSPYIVTGDVTVNAEVTLTIKAGVTVKFNNAIRLICNGILSAEGTVSEQITFTSNEVTPMAGNWQGLIFGTTAVNSKIDNCVIEYAYNGVDVDWSTIPGAQTSPVTIKNSTLQNIAYRGVNFRGKDDGSSTLYYNPVEHIVVTGNDFIDVGKSNAGSNPMAIYTRSVKGVDISDNLFLRGEGTYFAYLGVACEDYEFRDNIIRDPGYAQGIYVSIDYTNIKGGIPIISRNKFEGTATANNFRCIYISGHDGLVVKDNEFYTGNSGVYLLWFGGEGGDLIEGNLFDGVGTGNDDSFAIVDSLIGSYIGTVEIRNNTIKNTNGIGVWATPGNQGNCIIQGNNIESNTVGIRVGTDSWDVDTVSANFNTIVDNGVGLERIGTVSESFNATQNWWGDASGSKQATTNPSATGDEVSDNVEYFPWFTNSEKTTLVQFVTLTKTGPATANQGNDITYTITYKNEGTFDTTNIVVTETYPTEVEFISSDPAPDTGTNNKWTVRTLEAGNEGTIEITVKIK